MGGLVPLSHFRVSSMALLLVLTLGCAPALRIRELPALADEGTITRVAVAPFAARGATPGADVVSHQVAQALMERGLQVIPPSDVETALRGAPPEQATLVRVAAKEFGAQAVVIGRVSRFRGLDGKSLGAASPASVAFEVTLLAAPGGEPLWKADFDETQRPLSDNLFNAFRYPGGGSRWLTAEELVRWGASEVAKDLPTGG